METTQSPAPLSNISREQPAEIPATELHSSKAPAETVARQADDQADIIAPDPSDSESQRVDLATLDLAMHDARLVLDQQQQLRQLSLTQLNILFVVNTALLSILSITRLIFSLNWFSLLELGGFLLSFSLLIYALLPRPFLITPKLEDEDLLKSYLALSSDEYRLQMLINLRTVYEANKQRLDDITQALALASYALWVTVVLALSHLLAAMLVGIKP
jgi:hypothetical protein